jgi:LCP family protein required for cell wall assembly
MAIQSKTQTQSHVPPFVIQGVAGLMALTFLVVGLLTGYLFYQGIKNITKELVARTNLPTAPGQVNMAALPFILPISSDGNGSPIIKLPISLRGGETGATGITGVKLPNYEQKERVNILLLGIDKRPDDTLSRTDTMIVVTIDPNTMTAGMLSIPRDLYIPIPGYDGEDRINKAYYLGEKDGYPGGGPALAMKTIQDNFGIPIHFYAQIDFQGFRDMVDTLGGIEVDVPETIDDPTYPDENYGFDPFYIEAGHHLLDGHSALQYARTRHAAGSDFGRAARQQQVILAIRNKALELNMIPKIPELWSSFSTSIDTNLQLIDIVELSQLAGSIDAAKIQSAVIDHNYTVDYVTDQGGQVLLPLRDKIQTLIDSIFTQTEPNGPSQAEIDAQVQAQAQERANAIQQEVERQEELKTLLAKDNGRLVVLNGTDKADLATQTATYLEQQGFKVVQSGSADTTGYPHTVIVVYDENKTYTLQMLATLFNVQEENIRRSPSPQADLDFRVIIGSDFSVPDDAASFAAPK